MGIWFSRNVSASSSSSSAAIRDVEDNHNCHTKLITQPSRQQSLNEDEIYEIDITRIDPPNTLVTKIKQVAQGVFTIAISPIAFVGGVGAYLSMKYVFPTTWNEKWIATFVPLVCDNLDHKMHTEREMLLSRIHGKVLDLGTGGGAYLQYYANASNIVAIEPNTQMHPIIRATAKKHGIDNDKLHIHAGTLEDYLQQSDFEDNDNDKYFDWVVLGNVLCEVPDVQRILNCVDTCIRPTTGRIYFCEHVAACPKQNPIKRRIQSVLNPYWNVISGGCNITHDSHTLIHQMSSWNVISWTYHNISIGFGPLVLGLAYKQQ